MKTTALKRAGAVVGIVAAAGFGSAALAGTAHAAGTSASTNNCYAKWWNTAFNSYCVNASQSGNYRGVADCSSVDSNKYGKWVWISKGSTVSGFSGGECRFSVVRAWISYTNG